jgi:glutaminyl-tRNA synthetase
MYDFAHPISDALEKITHSICTLEFEDHRPLYDWSLEALDYMWHPQQIEFARLNINYTVMSKRKLLELVTKHYVSGWDDPRMPTICGLRRRGYTPESIRAFADRIGVAKTNSTVEIQVLEQCVREDLNKRAFRRMAVLNPLKLTITNYPADKEEWFDAENNPEDPDAGKRKVPWSNVVYIERDDFMEVPTKKYFRLAPGAEVRLKHAWLVRCTEVIKNAKGEIIELKGEIDPGSRGGDAPDGRSVKGTLHWVSAKHAVKAVVNLYDHLFNVSDPDQTKREGGDYKDNLNPGSLSVVKGALLEPELGNAKPGDRFQFLRLGYFVCDSDSKPGAPVFNRTVTLKDTWAKEAARG